MARTKTATVDEVMLCVTSHDTGRGFFREGSRVARSKITPYCGIYWVPDGSTDDEVAKAKFAHDSETLNPRHWENEHGPIATPQPLVECVKPLTFPTHVAIPNVGIQSGIVIFSVGDRLPANHHIVQDKRWKAYFEPVEDDEVQ
jgi:hypothetical protein